MRHLLVFNHISLDGYFTDRNGEMRWAHTGNDDPEYQAFVAGNAGGNGELLFGRKTYDLMASFWPTPAAMQMNPAVAEGMNRMPKVVFSRTLAQPPWQNTRAISGDIVEEVRRMKQAEGPGLTILGSGSIVAQLAPHHLVDEYQLMVNPLSLGQGRTLFDGIPGTLPLKLTKTRAFPNGKVLLCYQAV